MRIPDAAVNAVQCEICPGMFAYISSIRRNSMIQRDRDVKYVRAAVGEICAEKRVIPDALCLAESCIATASQNPTASVLSDVNEG